MKTLIATLLASAAGSAFALAPTAALNHDPATYRNVTQKVAADYKVASAKCDRMGGNEKDVCMAEAKLARARGESEAVAKYNNTDAGRNRARTMLANAEYELAKEKCDAMSGNDKDDCMNRARSAHTTAVADAKAGRDSRVAATGSGSAGGLVAGTDAPGASKAVDKCERLGGSERTACLVENKRAPATANGANLANRTEAATERAADKTQAAAATTAEKTRELAQAAADKTRQAASTVAQKTENALERAGEKTREVAASAARKTENAMERAGEKTRDTSANVAQRTDAATDNAAAKGKVAANKTANNVSDAAITTKVKANIFKEPELESMAIHVETENGVVMLSGFVDSKAEAEKAVKAAKGVEGVTSVKSAIKVK